MYQSIRGQGGHFVILISLKNTNLVDDIKVLLPVKFPEFRSVVLEEVENLSTNQRPGRPSCFPDRPEKSIRGIGH